jgi:hypothetical protein
MTLRAVLSLSVLIALACGGGDDPQPQPQPQPVEPEAEPPLAGYAYLAGPGGAEGARFSQFSNGDTVYVGVDDANLRDEAGNVIARLRLGTELRIVAPVSEPTVEIDRLNRWYTVTETGTDVAGRLFGGLLTPYGGQDFFQESDEGMRGWAVTFSPEGRPRLRVDKAFGSDEALTLDLTPSERFTGGRMEARLEHWDDFTTRFEVMLCRLDGGEAPECETVTADLNEDRTALVQLSPPDPSQYAAPWSRATCGAGSVLPLTISDTQGPVQIFKVPQYIRGPDSTVTCYDIGTVPSGEHAGKTMVSCVQPYAEKTGGYHVLIGRYLRDDTGWTYLPCASTFQEDAAIQSSLVNQRISVRVDTTVSGIEGLETFVTLPVGERTVTFSHHSPEYDPAALTEAFTSTVGTVYADDESLVIPHPDGTALLYYWKPADDWTTPPPSGRKYVSQSLSCAGTVDELMTFEPDVTAADLQTVATLADGTPVGRLSPSHPALLRRLAWYDELGRAADFERPPGLELAQSHEALLAGDPWLFVPTPWGAYIRLTREDFQLPQWCEPILYAYADPPAEIIIEPVPPLRFKRTVPHAPLGWHGMAQPDGSVVVSGRRWSELFWEGESVWFSPPAESVVVAEADIAAYLTAALQARGLVGREVDSFLDAWLPDLLDQGAVRIGFHDPEAIQALGPLQITPRPDTFIRVLMDAAPTDDPPDWDGSPPTLVPPERTGLVVVEWGGMVRP